MYTKLFELHKKESVAISTKLFENKKYPGSSPQAYSFLVPFLKSFYNKNFSYNELSKMITDCSFDGGIDAFYFGSKEYIDLFEVKEGGSISDKDIDKMITSLEKYLKRGEKYFVGDEAIKKNILRIKKNKSKKLRIFLGRTKLPFSKEDLYDKGKRKGNDKIRSCIKRLEEIGLTVFFVDIESLFLAKMKENNTTGSALFNIDKDLLAMNQQGAKEIIAKISVYNLFKQLIEKYDTKIISSNIRGHLNKKSFSEKMIETLKTDPKKFWIYHNGITVTCSKIEPTNPNPYTITIHNPQVVNGAQTMFGLLKAYKDGLLKEKLIKKASILCKFIEANNDLSKKICETSNTQNSVKSEDLVSNEEINLYLDEFIPAVSDRKFFYKRKKGGNSKKGIKSNEFFQWAYASFLGEPAASKNEKQFLFDFVTKRGKFRIIEQSIKDNLDSIFTLCEIAYFVKSRIKLEKNKDKQSLLRHMDMHLIAGLFLKKTVNSNAFDKIFNFLFIYYKKEIKKDPTKNANKIFTKEPSTWLELKKNLIKAN